jgi:hypothetical protein
MPITGIDENVKQAILQRSTLENVDLVSSVATLRSRRGSHVAGASFFTSPLPGSAGSGNAADLAGPRRQSRVQFSDLPAKDAQTLDLPGPSNATPEGTTLV